MGTNRLASLSVHPVSFKLKRFLGLCVVPLNIADWNTVIVKTAFSDTDPMCFRHCMQNTKQDTRAQASSIRLTVCTTACQATPTGIIYCKPFTVLLQGSCEHEHSPNCWDRSGFSLVCETFAATSRETVGFGTPEPARRENNGNEQHVCEIASARSR